MSKEESYLNNSYNDDNNNMNLYNSKNSISNNGEEEFDKDRLNEIIKNFSSKIITKISNNLSKTKMNCLKHYILNMSQ